MHFFFCLALLVRLILAIPVEDLFFSNEAVDPNDVGYSLAALDPSLASEDIFAAHADSFSPPYSLAADIDLCVFGENDGQPTSKVRVRDTCPPASNANPQLSLPTLDQLPLASDSSGVDNYDDLQRLFNVETYLNVKEYDPDNMCPAAKTFGSKIPVCFTGERVWDRIRAFGRDYCTLYRIRPYSPLTLCINQGFDFEPLYCCASIGLEFNPLSDVPVDVFGNLRSDIQGRPQPAVLTGYVCYDPAA